MRKHLIALLAAIIAFPAFAQEENSEAQATTRAATPQEITRNVHGDWQIRCTTGESQQCYLYQLIVGDQNNPLLEYTLVPVKDETGEGVVLGSTIITPLNVVLGRGIILQVDENDPTQRPYGWCAQIGCFVRFGLNQASVDQYISGSKITAVIFSMQNPQAGIEIDLPLNGFGDAYKELMEIEAAAKAE